MGKFQIDELKCYLHYFAYSLNFSDAVQLRQYTNPLNRIVTVITLINQRTKPKVKLKKLPKKNLRRTRRKLNQKQYILEILKNSILLVSIPTISFVAETRSTETTSTKTKSSKTRKAETTSFEVENPTLAYCRRCDKDIRMS